MEKIQLSGKVGGPMSFVENIPTPVEWVLDHKFNWAERIALRVASWMVWLVVRGRWPVSGLTVLQDVCLIPTLLRERDVALEDEVNVLEERLARLYDPARALSEATNRLQSRKVELRDELTNKQKLALEYQKRHLRGVLRRS